MTIPSYTKDRLINALEWCKEGVRLAKPETRPDALDLFAWDCLSASLHFVANLFQQAAMESTIDRELSFLGEEPTSRIEAIESVEDFLDKCIERLKTDLLDCMQVYVRATTYAILLKSED